MSARIAATVGNGRILARIGRDGSLISLNAPRLDHDVLETHMYAVVRRPRVHRRIGGAGWKHQLEYVRGTNVLRVVSSHTTGINVERRLVAIGERLQAAFRSEPDTEVGWEQGLGEVLPQAGIRFDPASRIAVQSRTSTPAASSSSRSTTTARVHSPPGETRTC